MDNQFLSLEISAEQAREFALDCFDTIIKNIRRTIPFERENAPAESNKRS